MRDMKAKIHKSISVSHHNQAIRIKKESGHYQQASEQQREHECGNIEAKLREELRKLLRNHRQ